MRAANEIARFLLELAALAAFGYGAAQLVDSPVRFALAPAAILAGATVWGVFVAPKSTRRLADPLRLAVEIAFFTAAGGTLLAISAPWLGLVLTILGVTNAVSLRFLDSVLGALG